MWRAAERLVERAAQRGLQAIVVDDLHFADPASTEALHHLAGGPVREWLRFGFTSRPRGEGAMKTGLDDWLAGENAPIVVAVEPFQVDELREFLPTLQLAGTAARVTPERLHAHVGGNPFLVLQTLRELTCRGVHGDALPLPTQPHRLMQRRLAVLSGPLRDVLELAAVLDADFTAALAASATDRPVREVLASVGELTSLGILCNGRFVHDLMRQSALAIVGDERLPALHAWAAAALASTHAPRARVAALWETAQHWAQAADAYHAAAKQARDAGRPLESVGLFERAAACHSEAGDRAGQFDALYELFEEAMLRDEKAAQAQISRLGAIACCDEHRARIAIARAQVGVRAYDDRSLLGRAALALALAEPFDHLLPDALQTHGLALVQAGRFDEADEATTRAEALARQSGRLRRVLTICTDRAYARLTQGRFGDAIAMTRHMIGEFEGLGDTTSARRMEGNLANLLLGAGDPQGALAAGRRTHAYHCEIRLARNSSLPAVVATSLASALAHAGHFDKALKRLLPTWQCWPEPTAEPLYAKVSVTLANLWLLLGCDEEAEAALVPAAPSLPSLEVQWCLAKARIAAMRGRPEPLWLDRIGSVQKANWDAPLSHASWLDWSHQGDPREVAEQMVRVQHMFARNGMPGAARSAALRAVARWNEIDAAWAIEAAHALACEAASGLQAGAHASTYPPEAWQIAAHACARADDTARAGDYLRLARSWIDQALAHIPAAAHNSFIERNPTNRAILGATAA